MTQIHIRRFGFACGATTVLLYLGCMLVMATVGRNGTVLFLNSLLHGLDVSSIVRMNMPITEVLMGIVQTFILGWLTGACIAAFYNIFDKKAD
ncbi:MAG: DUF5676 family membrane protein [Bacteroidota bacterium]|jgi:hypothetical protein